MLSWALDLDGVIWTGRDPIPGAADAIGQLQSAGHPVAFVTNNSFSTIAEQEQKLASFGIDASGMVITSAMAAASLLSPHERVHVFGGPGVVEAVQNQGAVVVDGDDARTEGVDTVIVGLDSNLSYQRLADAITAVLNGARLIATNTDSTYPTERGLQPGAGTMVKAVEYGTNTEAVVAGKPSQPQAALVTALLGPEGVMVGDRPETDGDFAATLGYKFGLVFSGVTSRQDLPVSPEPDVTASDLARMVADLTT